MVYQWREYKYLPREIESTFPFDVFQIDRFLQLTSVDRHSNMTRLMRQTLEGCATKPVKGKKVKCVRTLEDMVDMLTFELRKGPIDVAWSNVTNLGMQELNFSVVSEMGVIGKSLIAWHKRAYPYAHMQFAFATGSSPALATKFLCGQKTYLPRVCDVSYWDPNHVSFRALPEGGVPICHFSSATPWSYIYLLEPQHAGIRCLS